jgi:hypothetical protein
VLPTESQPHHERRLLTRPCPIHVHRLDPEPVAPWRGLLPVDIFHRLQRKRVRRVAADRLARAVSLRAPDVGVAVDIQVAAAALTSLGAVADVLACGGLTVEVEVVAVVPHQRARHVAPLRPGGEEPPPELPRRSSRR